MAGQYLVPQEIALFYWPSQPRVVPRAHVIQQLAKERGKAPSLINRECIFLTSLELMFPYFLMVMGTVI